LADIKLFQLQSDSARELRAESVDIEKSLQSLMERHLDSFLGVRFLATEYLTGKRLAGALFRSKANGQVFAGAHTVSMDCADHFNRTLGQFVHSHIFGLSNIRPDAATLLLVPKLAEPAQHDSQAQKSEGRRLGS
jgi:hypothetical protein